MEKTVKWDLSKHQHSGETSVSISPTDIWECLLQIYIYILKSLDGVWAAEPTEMLLLTPGRTIWTFRKKCAWERYRWLV